MKAKAPEEDPIEDNCCELVINWICVATLLAAIIGTTDESLYTVMTLGFLMFALFMCCNAFIQFNSTSYSYLSNVIEEKDLEGYMKKLFYNAPKKTVYVECYHNERTGSGKHRRTKKVVTFSQYFYFQYSSWRDISGKFDFQKAGKKDFCRFRINYKISQNDPETQTLYNNFINHLRKNFENRDKHFSLVEIDQLDDLKKYNMVKLGKEDNSLLSQGMFTLAFLTLTIDLYKCYLRSSTSFEEFSITKAISCTQNLQDETDLNQFNPCLAFEGHNMVFDEAPPVNANDWLGKPIDNNYAVPGENDVKEGSQVGFNPATPNNEGGFGSSQVGNNPNQGGNQGFGGVNDIKKDDQKSAGNQGKDQGIPNFGFQGTENMDYKGMNSYINNMASVPLAEEEKNPSKKEGEHLKEEEVEENSDLPAFIKDNSANVVKRRRTFTGKDNQI